ncbi:MBL fold metallo-hydrolase [Deinococcus enclensis]|uniref:L-ascorbate metabolism protein UlaG (Beta-lactamase superfamily) n=1 Tax=Deinococcus enclensis TaxID=1049582 RepID=A0ABT9MHM0_9DEIO|nr:MBL fold metallo-hydrolase [Deinococcus enclensis]MDP9765956.1 L-ascorbate metabolism protein UlaG (beta-lactamase superfamily) [Deinococcus enclensis]
MQLHLLRNATLRLHYAGRTLLIDPMLGPVHTFRSLAGREENPTAPLPLPAEDAVRGLDGVIVSHLHPDHFDEVAARLLPRDLPLLCRSGDEAFFTGQGFTQVTPLTGPADWLGLTVQPTAGQHGTGPILDRMGEVTGFLLSAPDEPTLYWAGDTILYPPVLDVLRDARPDVVVTHSGGAALMDTPIIMDAAQTLDVLRAAPAARVVATHLGALDHCFTTRQDLRAAADAAGIAPERLLIPADNETLTLTR